MHLANSHYAYDFLESKRIKSTILKGYISEFYDGKFDLNKKKNVILFNPTKDHIHYKNIMNQFPEYEFVALANLTNHQICVILFIADPGDDHDLSKYNFPAKTPPKAFHFSIEDIR